MAVLANNIQLGRESAVYIKFENLTTTPPALAFPTLGDNNYGLASNYPAAALYVASTGTFNQQPTFTNSAEVANTRSLVDRFVDMNPAGTWNFDVYARMKSTISNILAPDAHILYQAAMGGYSYIASPATYHKYYPALTLPSFSTWFVNNDMVFACRGCTVNEMKSNIINKGALTFAFSGQFMDMFYAGKVDTYVSAGVKASWSAPKLTLAQAGDYRYFKTDTNTTSNPSPYAGGMRVRIYDASASGYVANTGTRGGDYFVIASVNSADNSLSFVTTADAMTYTPDVGDYIEPWKPTVVLPTNSTVVESRNSSVLFDGTAVNILSSDFTFSNAIKYQEDEVTTAASPVSYVADQRSVTAATNLYFRRTTLPYFQKGFEKATIIFKVLGLPSATGTTANAMALIMPKCMGGVPALSGDLERQLAIDFTALTPTGVNETEVSLNFGNVAGL